MKRAMLMLIGALLIGTTGFYLFREPIKEMAYATLTDNMFVDTDEDEFDPGPAVGSSFPGLKALHQGREISLLQEFAGENGTILMASRSFDWCPYCMRQMIELQKSRSAYDEAGIGLVAITYDSPQKQQAFADDHDIDIPILSDINALSFKTLGILNKTYHPGDVQYGIPHPGMIVVDPQGKIAGKLFLKAYSSRVDAQSALAFALERLGP